MGTGGIKTAYISQSYLFLAFARVKSFTLFKAALPPFERDDLLTWTVLALRTSCCYSESNIVLSASCSALTFKSVSVGLIEWLADLCWNTNSTCSAPNAFPSCLLLLLLLLCWNSATILFSAQIISWKRLLIWLYLLFAHFLLTGWRKSFSRSEGSIDQKGRSCRLLWISWLFNIWIGRLQTWLSVCLLIEWMSWSVIEMRLKETGGLLVGPKQQEVAHDVGLWLCV